MKYLKEFLVVGLCALLMIQAPMAISQGYNGCSGYDAPGGGTQTALGGTLNNGAFVLPYKTTAAQLATNFSAVGLIDAAAEKVAFIFTVPKTGTLDKIEFRVATVGNNPDNGIRISLQNVDLATGDPDGTQDQFRDITGTITSNTWQVPGLMTSDGTDGGIKRSVTQGELLAVVAEFVSFTAGDTLSPFTVWAAVNSSGPNFPYGDAFTAAWVKSTIGGFDFILKYSDGSYVTTTYSFPFLVGTTLTVGNATTPDEVALKIAPPVAMTINGAFIHCDCDGDTDIILYDSADTVLASVSYDSNSRVVTGTGPIAVSFPEIVLSAGATYRLAIKPTTATTLSASSASFSSTTIRDAFMGDSFSYSSRTDAGAWTDVATDHLVAGVFVSKVNN